jgi:transposase
MVFWPSWYIDPGFSFVYHSRLTICDCLRFTKVCFCPYTLEKQFCLNDINSSVIPCLDENQRLRTIGMLQAGLAQNVVARHFGCHRNTILSLWRQFRQSGSTRDRRRSGRPRVMSRRPRVMSRRQDNHIRLVHLRNRFQTSSLTARSIPGLRPISSRTVRNRLREHNIRPRHSAIRPILLPRHGAARLTWYRCYLWFRIQDWANILFTDESRFHLNSSDGRSRVYCHVGYADACIIQRQSFGGGSVMVWGGITQHMAHHWLLLPEIWPVYAIGMKLFSLRSFRSFKLSPTTSHFSRTTLNHMLRE